MRNNQFLNKDKSKMLAITDKHRRLHPLLSEDSSSVSKWFASRCFDEMGNVTVVTFTEEAAHKSVRDAEHAQLCMRTSDGELRRGA